jgi:Periplasmic binding protein
MSIARTPEAGAPVALSGRYAAQGAAVRAGLELWARWAGLGLVVLDDGSEPAGSVRATRQLIARGCRIVLGPYGSDCVRAVARECAGAVVWNHGGASDDVQRLPGVVSVSAPSSRYLVALGRAVERLWPGARVAVLTAPGRFARFASEGLEAEASMLGLELVGDVAGADAVFLCGPLEWEQERLCGLVDRDDVLLASVSAGLASVPGARTWPEGTLAPVQWHPDLPSEPALGPRSVPLADYVGAQAYAAALVAERCLELDPADPLAAARTLLTSTFFGAFELDADGLQRGHRLSVVRRRAGVAELFLAEAA